MDRPFREIHELYKIVYERAEAQAAVEAARKAEEEEKRKNEERSNISRGAAKPQIHRQPPPDAKIESYNSIPVPSPLAASEIEDAIEEMLEGGVT